MATGKRTSPIRIKESHRGLFTEQAKRAGEGVQEFASRVMANKDNYSPATVKRANFSKVSKSWNR